MDEMERARRSADRAVRWSTLSLWLLAAPLLLGAVVFVVVLLWLL